jgi:hypothetical protein
MATDHAYLHDRAGLCDEFYYFSFVQIKS